MKTIKIALILMVLLACNVALSANISTTERQALIDLYTSTNGASWTTQTNWNGAAGTENTWYGVTTDAGNTTVLELHLQSNNLVGTLPSSLGNLSNLQNLSLYSNQLTGSIPPELGNLSNLQILNLYDNQLTGSIPTELGSLSNLTQLNLFLNQLTGNIPTELGNLSNLTYLDLYYNQLTGSIPTSLGSLANLGTLSLSSNQLTGGIPTSLGGLSNLTVLALSENQLTGSVPTELGNLSKLTELYLFDNQLTGSVPTSLGSLSNLQLFELYSNLLTGSIPTELGNLSNLTYLDLGSNQLTGSIPTELGNLSNLQNLSLPFNQLTGTIPTSLGNLSNLTFLDLPYNQLTGSIPTSLGSLANLGTLSLFFNQLTGSIPTELGNLSKLTYLGLSSNMLTGNIPTSLTNLTSVSSSQTPYFPIDYNALHTSDAALIAFLTSIDSSWAATQTIAPVNVSAVPDSTSVMVSWTPVTYTDDPGSYRISFATVSGGPYTFYAQTTDKSASSQLVSGLTSGTPYYFVVQTRTNADLHNLNVVDSDYSLEAPATTSGIAPIITVTSPNGGESWVVGSSHNITWSSTGTIANVKIEYSTNSGSSYATVIASTTNNGTYAWTIPSTLSTTCLVRVSDATNAATSDVSNAVFSIVGATSVTVSSPNGGESWVVGSSHNITWSSTGTIANVKIEYSTNSGSSYATVIASTTNNGTYAWTIPNTPSTTCLVRVSDASNAATSDVSNAVFTITATPTVTVTSPNGTESWAGGSSHNITWTSTGTIANVKIEYSTNSGSSYATVIASTTNNGTYAWTIPNTPSTTCLVRVSDASNAATSDVSDAVFTITATPTVTVTSPNGTESWAGGSSHNVTWTSTGTIANVKIEYSTNSGSSYATVIASTTNNGTYAWTIPNTPSTTCLVRVSDASNAATNDVSNAVFTITATPTVTVTSPNGTESWAGGSSHNVTWTSTGTIANVKIEYSTNSGSSYATVIASTTNNGTYAWTIPNTPSTTCLVRVSDASNAATSDVSDAVFTITATPTVTVTSPNGTESWAGGSSHNVTWTSTGTIANVKIEYSTNSGSSYATVIASTTNNGTYAWTIPNTPSTTCLVRVSDASNAATSDVSDAVFTITATPTVTVTSPNGTESWAGGSSHNVTWTSTGTIANVKIEYSTNSGSSYATVIASTTNNGTYAWTIPNTPSTTCLVRVSDASNAATSDVSDAVFTITATPTVTVTSPNGTESWAGGSSHNVTWTSTGTIANVKIEYSTNSGSSYTTVIATTANNGTYAWTIPNTPSTTCLVRVSDASNAATSDVSDAVFTITATPTVTVTSPNGTESWAGGSSHNITWTSTGTIANVKIEYSTNSGSSYATVIASTTNNGTYAWTIPNTPSTTCLVRVSDASNAATSDVSDAVFTITATPSVTVTSPNGAESWVGNSSHNITWTSTGTIANVKIEYSTNSGSSYTTVIATTANNGTYAWTIPNTPSTTCLVRVSDASNAATSDVSDAVFTITASSIPIILVDKTNMYFGATSSSVNTGAQPLSISNSGTGTLSWTAAKNANWITVSPTSGTGNAVLQIGANPSGLTVGKHQGTVSITDPNATNSPQTINVTLNIIGTGLSAPPFGDYSTPLDGTTGITGAIPVTGWALDDIEVTGVTIYRNPVAGEPTQPNGLVLIGDAVFVEGARPDVELAYPTYPFNDRAGWGYMMLTNFLPNQGNGTFKIYAYATDSEANTVLLGMKTITCSNAAAVKPFGTIDTPAQGGDASGNAYVNFGWVLTPKPNTVPIDGSTISVWVDGVQAGALNEAPNAYDQYRSDIATDFPGLNNSAGPVGFSYLDTTAFTNGVHTIYWIATDNVGNADGIGSRFFNIVNTGTSSSQSTQADQSIGVKGLDSYDSVMNLPVSFEPQNVNIGFNLNNEPEAIQPDANGVVHIVLREVERLELDLKALPAEASTALGSYAYSGFLVFGNQLRPLPIGSTLDQRKGTFIWLPGPGFLGPYQLVFLRTNPAGVQTKIQMNIMIVPKFGLNADGAPIQSHRIR